MSDATSPRDLSAEIAAALADGHLQDALFNATHLAVTLRLNAIAALPDYEGSRDLAREIKERSIADLPGLLDTLEAAVEKAGGKVLRAADAGEACRMVVEIARREGVRTIVKSKSMTTEEIHLNPALEAAGLVVRETDLGEYIVQLAGDRPSHIIAPIIHMGLEQVRETLRRALGRDDVPETAEGMTQLAREELRRQFLEADMGITGANFLLADTGTVVVVENEGNARLSTQLPRVHVAVAGIEKVIPTVADLEPFLELLPRSATGQLLTSYLSFITGPGWQGSPLVEGGERVFYLVLLDNGRMAMRADPLLREALYCVRCGACLNSCAPYQAVGGHVYGGATYQSGIGNAWEAGVRGLEAAAEFNALCTTCTRCRDVCPVHIDIPLINAKLRDRIDRGRPGLAARWFGDPRRPYRLARRAGPLGRALARFGPFRAMLNRVAGISVDRELPLPAGPRLSDWFAGRGGIVVTEARTAAAAVADDRGAASRGVESGSDRHPVALFVDCHTEHLDAQVGRAAVRVLEHVGHEVVVVSGPCCGRAALSQGMIDRSRRLAAETEGVLQPFAVSGWPIVGIEPSCAACIHHDHALLLDAEDGRGMAPVIEIVAYLERFVDRIVEDASACADGNDARSQEDSGVAAKQYPVVVHGHCQQKTEGWLPATLGLLGRLPGVKVQATRAECCGMAGSFGFKSDFVGVSRQLGARLQQELDILAPRGGEPATVVASGTSCRMQIGEQCERRAIHPVELIADRLGLGE